jgi:hypothetical protein
MGSNFRILFDPIGLVRGKPGGVDKPKLFGAGCTRAADVSTSSRLGPLVLAHESQVSLRGS